MKMLQKTAAAVLTFFLLLSLSTGVFADSGYAEYAVPVDVTNVVCAAEGYAVVCNAAGAYAVIDQNGRYIVEYDVYSWIDAFSEGLALVKTSSDRGRCWAYINTDGQIVLDASDWDEAGAFHSGLALVRSGTQQGFIDTAGRLVLDCSGYSYVGEFSDGYALVGTADADRTTYGFINTNGSTIIGGLISATDFSGGYALVEVYNTLSRKNITCLIDASGTPTVDLSEYQNLSAVSDDMILVQAQAGTQMDMYGYMDQTGRIVIECPGCEFVYPFSDGLALTEYLDNSGTLCYRFLDENGDIFLDLGSCDLALSYCDGYAIYTDSGYWYLIDTNADISFCSAAYSAFDNFSDGVLVAHTAGQNGSKSYTLLDCRGSILAADLQYDYIDAFSDGLALAYRYNSQTKLYSYYFIDTAGSVILDCSSYDSVGTFSENLLLVCDYRADADGHFAGSKSYFIDRTGQTVLDCSDYSNVSAFSNGLALVTGNDTKTLKDIYQFIDSSGNVVIDCSGYDGASSFHDSISVVTRVSAQTGKNQFALMATDGSLLTDWLNYNTVSGYSDGYCVVNYSGTQGMVDHAFYMYTDGSIALENLPYDEMNSFYDEMAVVGTQTNGSISYGCIDKTGALVIDTNYDEILPFSDSVTWARRGGTWYCLRRPDSAVKQDTDNPIFVQQTEEQSSSRTDDISLPFTDISSADWFYESVCLACENDLMNGITQSLFDPDGTVTLGQAVTLAVRAHCRYFDLDPVEAETDGRWYQPYVDYAIQTGLITGQEFSDYDAFATRAELAYLFSRILPEDQFDVVNFILSIPDVPISHPYFDKILLMYQSGVLTGYSDGSFQPDSTVRRSEAAAIITRVILKSQRNTLQ